MIKSKFLREQISNYFGKDFDEMTEEEKRQVTMVVLSQKDVRGEETDACFSDLEELPALERCVVQDFYLSDSDIDILNRIKYLRGLQFSKCNFSGVRRHLRGLELLVLDGCRNVVDSIISDLEDLKFIRVIDQDMFDAKALEKCKALERAYLQRTVIRNLNELGRLKSLKSVNLDCSKFNYLAATNLKRNVHVEFKMTGEPERDGL